MAAAPCLCGTKQAIRCVSLRHIGQRRVNRCDGSPVLGGSGPKGDGHWTFYYDRRVRGYGRAGRLKKRIPEKDECGNQKSVFHLLSTWRRASSIALQASSTAVDLYLERMLTTHSRSDNSWLLVPLSAMASSCG